MPRGRTPSRCSTSDQRRAEGAANRFTATNQGNADQVDRKLGADQIGSMERLGANRHRCLREAEPTRANQSEDQQAKIDATAKLVEAQQRQDPARTRPTTPPRRHCRRAWCSGRHDVKIGAAAGEPARPLTNLLTSPSVNRSTPTAATTPIGKHSQSLDKFSEATTATGRHQYRPRGDAQQRRARLGPADVPRSAGWSARRPRKRLSGPSIQFARQ